jgi:hypothetical protein
MTLATLALLWHTSGGVAMVLTACCPDQKPCCTLLAPQATCSSCAQAPMALAAVGAAPAPFSVAAADTSVLALPPGRVAINIWRPPMMDGLYTQANLHQPRLELP